ncbi:glycosyltransferase family 4 protein [candidate division WOR-3 bacterium]|nr:glycosyltransferase family 4 protein [candidate division WOR-3 bacterium]
MKSHIAYRILVLAPTPFFSDRGCHVRIYEQTKILQKISPETSSGEVVIITYHIGKDIKGLQIERIPYIPWYKKYEAGPSLHKIGLDFLILLKSIQVAKSFKPTIIHSHLHEGAFIGSILSKLFKIPLIFDYQGSLSSELIQHGVKRGLKFIRFLERKIDNLPDVIFTNSNKAKRDLINDFKVSPAKIKIIHDCVDLKTFKRVETGLIPVLKKIGIPKGKKIIVYLGYLSDYQGIPLLLEAAKIVLKERRDIHFLILGYPRVDYYRERAKTLGLEESATFLGRISYFEAYKYLSLADVAVSPKLSRTEGNGKLLNYMAIGLPIVAFESKINYEILGDEGIYAKFSDPVSLAQKLLYALGRTTTYNRLKSFDSEEIGKKIIKEYKLLFRRLG